MQKRYGNFFYYISMHYVGYPKAVPEVIYCFAIYVNTYTL